MPQSWFVFTCINYNEENKLYTKKKINYNEENNLFKGEHQLKYKRGVVRVQARSFQILQPEFLIEDF